MTKRSRILIVDDEPLNVDYLEQRLESFGYDTLSATDGRQALEEVAAHRPDLILLDVMMPKMDGFAVCRVLKDDPDTRLIPVVMMTALNAVEDRIKGIEAGADDFLSKPVDPRELMARIKTALRVKHTVDDRIGELEGVASHLEKFVPEAVKRLVAANPEAPELSKRERDVSVLFLDISDYTRLSEQLAPDILNTLVERYFSAYLDSIHHAGGDISETSGDGLMVIFSDPEPARHAIVAAETALALLADTAAMNRESRFPPLALHMGLNSGPALVGSTRFEGKRGVRWVFTADGPMINLAARLAAAATDGQILVGPEAAGRLDERFQLHKLGYEKFKNISEPVEVHRIEGRRT